MPIAHWSDLRAVLVIGSVLRQEQPLLAVRLRRAARSGAQVHRVAARREDWAMPVAETLVGKPSEWPALLGEILSAAAQQTGTPLPEDLLPLTTAMPSSAALLIASDLVAAQGKSAVVLGQLAQQHPDYATLYRLAQVLGDVTGAPFGQLALAANTVGAALAGALPRRGAFHTHAQTGLDAQAQWRQPRQAYVMMGLEPSLDCADPSLALKALRQAETVVALSAFKGEAEQWATIMLPIAPFAETAGTFVSMEGRVQSFNGVVPPRGEARPAWKIWRVLGNLFDCPGFAQENLEEVRTEISPDLPLVCREALNNQLTRAPALKVRASLGTVERVGELPGYHADPLVRRAPALQGTALAGDIRVVLHPAQASSLGLSAGQWVRVSQGGGSVVLPVTLDETLAEGCAVVPIAHPLCASLGESMGMVVLEGA